MGKIAVVFWSGTGNTEIMADSIIEGIKNAGGDVDRLGPSDFNESTIANYDKIAFGCPAMGAEELEPDEFEPMFAAVENSLGDKPIALFGSYEWADGEWMESWQNRVKSNGSNLIGDGLIIYDTPDDDGKAKCVAFGESFAKA